MATLIQSLSWTLILSVGQGALVFSLLWLMLKALSVSANARYHFSLFALATLPVWFAATWWQLYHSFSAVALHADSVVVQSTVIFWPAPTEGAAGYHWLPLSAQKNLPWLAAFYFVGLVVMLVRLSGGMLQVFYISKRHIMTPGGALNELLSGLKDRMRLSMPVRLFISAKAQVPMVVGILKPIILLPAATVAQLTTQQLETIVLHELAHIRRHDYLVNILQTVVETILFFNPFVWSISGIIRRERELCCDDMVLAYTHEPLDYATALATLADNYAGAPILSLAAAGRSRHLFGRIERILEAKKNSFSYSRMAAALVVCLAIMCSVAWLVPSFTKTKTKPVGRSVVQAPAAPQVHKAPVINEIKSVEKKEKSAPGTLAVTHIQKTPPQEVTDENILVNRLVADGMVDVIAGFVVEKKQDKLYINDQLQSDDIAVKYLPAIKKENMTIRVFSFEERQRMHPNAGFIQLLLPTTFSSPCVDYQPKKPGC